MSEFRLPTIGMLYTLPVEIIEIKSQQKMLQENDQSSDAPYAVKVIYFSAGFLQSVSTYLC